MMGTMKDRIGDLTNGLGALEGMVCEAHAWN